MKPELLTIKNIGPFVGIHKIDFTKLDSIFLVFGNTGAGKTTIFDAISYAFFSKPSGSRAAITRGLRSQFAPDNETAEVEISFTMGIKKYRILRRLPFLKPGKKSETSEEVELSEFKNKWIDLTCTNKKETDKKILKIIKLTEKEFSRIVLLPQGQFAEFLKENSKLKMNTLSQLFPVSKYTEIMNLAKEKEKLKQEKINYIRNSLETIEKQFSETAYLNEKETLDQELKLIRKNYLEASEKIKQKSAELEQAKILTHKQNELNDTNKKILALDSKQDIINNLSIQAEKARRASSLSGKAESIKKLTASINEYKIDIQEKINLLNDINKTFVELKSQEDIIAIEKETAIQLKQNLKLLERAKDIKLEIDNKTEQIKYITNQKKQVLAKLSEIGPNENEYETKLLEYQKIIEQFDNRNKNFEDINSEFIYTKKIIEITEKKERYEKNLKTHSIAANNNKNDLEIILKDISIEEENLKNLNKQKEFEELNQKSVAIAINLKENKPCPVCGSIHHPAPATTTGTDLISINDKIERCKRAIANLATRKDELDKSYAERKRDVENFKTHIEENSEYFKNLNIEFSNYKFTYNEIPNYDLVKTKFQKISKDTETARALLKEVQTTTTSKTEIEKKLNEIRKAKTKLQTDATDLKLRETSGVTSLKEKQEQYNEAFAELDKKFITASIYETIENCEAEILTLNRKINGYEESLSENISRKTKTETTIKEKKEVMEKWEHSLQKEQIALDKELKTKNFSSIEELLDSILDDDQIKEFENEIENFNTEKIILNQTKKSLEAELNDRNIIQPETILNEINLLQKTIDEEQIRASDLTTKLTQIKNTFEQRKNLIFELQQAEEKARTISELSSDLNGDNKYKLKFDIWMLSAFLREITAYANIRLEKMSNGRFILKVSDDAIGNNLAGLDLEIYDAYTGGSRSTASLSGGETFLVSISLALGLADSIQNRNGGIKLDSMFIDEGFGTLDETSLENAISILDEIRGNRMIGIISHINELQTRIPQKIYIEKTSKGSHIKFE